MFAPVSSRRRKARTCCASTLYLLSFVLCRTSLKVHAATEASGSTSPMAETTTPPIDKCPDGHTSPTGRPPGCYDPCNATHHKILDQEWRSIHWAMEEGQGLMCDNQLALDWYRFIQLEGDLMPTHVPQPRACSTSAQVWLNGVLPRVDEGVAMRNVCLASNNSCDATWSIHIRNCDGNFYVYRLPPTSNCDWVYCIGTYKPCPPGHTSSNGFEPGCVDVNECVNFNPCLNGGRCVNQVGNFTCDCPAGWFGYLCSIDKDECISSPCLNNGLCSNTLGSFSCSCQPGQFGDLCEYSYFNSVCPSKFKDFCLNNSTCYWTEAETLHCRCLDDYSGERCEQKIGTTEFLLPTTETDDGPGQFGDEELGEAGEAPFVDETLLLTVMVVILVFTLALFSGFVWMVWKQRQIIDSLLLPKTSQKVGSDEHMAIIAIKNDYTTQFEDEEANVKEGEKEKKEHGHHHHHHHRHSFKERRESFKEDGTHHHRKEDMSNEQNLEGVKSIAAREHRDEEYGHHHHHGRQRRDSARSHSDFKQPEDH